MGAQLQPCRLARYINPTLITKFVMLLPATREQPAPWLLLSREPAQLSRLQGCPGTAARLVGVALVGSWSRGGAGVCRPWLLDGRAARAAAARMPGSNPGSAAVLAVLCQHPGRAAARLVVLLAGSWRIEEPRRCWCVSPNGRAARAEAW